MTMKMPPVRRNINRCIKLVNTNGNRICALGLSAHIFLSTPRIIVRWQRMTNHAPTISGA